MGRLAIYNDHYLSCLLAIQNFQCLKVCGCVILSAVNGLDFIFCKKKNIRMSVVSMIDWGFLEASKPWNLLQFLCLMGFLFKLVKWLFKIKWALITCLFILHNWFKLNKLKIFQTYCTSDFKKDFQIKIQPLTTHRHAKLKWGKSIVCKKFYTGTKYISSSDRQTLLVHRHFNTHSRLGKMY